MMSLIKNKKAQGVIGKILTSIPVMIILVLLMAGFVILSSFITAIKKPVQPSLLAASEFGENSALLKTADISIDGKDTKILVIDALVMYERESLERDILDHALKGLVDKEHPCLGIAKGSERNPAGEPGGNAIDDFYLYLEGDEVKSANFGSFPSLFSKYRESKLLSEVVINLGEGKTMYVESYYGACLA